MRAARRSIARPPTNDLEIAPLMQHGNDDNLVSYVGVVNRIWKSADERPAETSIADRVAFRAGIDPAKGCADLFDNRSA